MNCPNCGTLIKNKNTKNCEYCGYLLDFDNEIKEEVTSREYYGSFKIKKEECEDIFSKWLAKLKLSKNNAHSVSLIKEIKPYYLPSYLMNGSGKIKFLYRVSRQIIIKPTDPNKEPIKQIVVTDPKRREFVFGPVAKNLLGTREIDEYSFNLLLPFKYETYINKKQENFECLPITIEKVVATAKFKKHLAKEYEPRLKEQDGDRVQIDDTNVELNLTEDDLYYLPIYKGIYNYKNKPFLFYINAESGKISGTYPLSKGKVMSIIFIVLIIFIIGVLIVLNFV